jgi:small subunit ribosomal protein S13
VKELKDFKLFVRKNIQKSTFTALKKIRGVGAKCLKRVVLVNGWCKHVKIENFVKKEKAKMFKIRTKPQISFFYELEDNKIFNNVAEKKRRKSYSGMRHIFKLPVRGQRTHTNASTSKTNIKREF